MGIFDAFSRKPERDEPPPPPGNGMQPGCLLVDYENVALRKRQLDATVRLLEERWQRRVDVVVLYSQIAPAKRDLLNSVSAIRVQHIGNGKNALDIRLTIEATDRCVRAHCRHFAIAAKDSDYTPLVRFLQSWRSVILGVRKDGDMRINKALESIADDWVLVTETGRAFLASERQDEEADPGEISGVVRLPPADRAGLAKAARAASKRPARGARPAAEQPAAVPSVEPGVDPAAAAALSRMVWPRVGEEPVPVDELHRALRDVDGYMDALKIVAADKPKLGGWPRLTHALKKLPGTYRVRRTKQDGRSFTTVSVTEGAGAPTTVLSPPAPAPEPEDLPAAAIEPIADELGAEDLLLDCVLAHLGEEPMRMRSLYNLCRAESGFNDALKAADIGERKAAGPVRFQFALKNYPAHVRVYQKRVDGKNDRWVKRVEEAPPELDIAELSEILHDMLDESGGALRVDVIPQLLADELDLDVGELLRGIAYQTGSTTIVDFLRSHCGGKFEVYENPGKTGWMVDLAEAA